MTNSMWLAAEGDCESDGGHLLVPETAEENAYLATVAAGTNEGFTWVGASDHLREGTFLAVDGRGVAPFSHWPGDLEPNNFDRREDCVQVDYAGYWNDCACDYFLAYVCECDFVLPATPSYCDTFATTSCGECSTPCATGTTCQSDQVCR